MEEANIVNAVLRTIEGKSTIEEAASELGLSTREVCACREMYTAGLRHAFTFEERRGTPSETRRVSTLRASATFAVVLLFIAVGVAAAPSEPLPCEESDDFFCFVENTPAKASEINHNFSAAAQWLEDAVGPIDAPIVSSSDGVTSIDQSAEVQGDMQVSGTFTAGGIVVSNDVEVYGNLIVDGDIAGAVDAIGKLDTAVGTGEVYNTPDTRSWNLGSTTNRFCAVTRIHSSSGAFTCYIGSSGGNYTLFADTVGSGYIGCWANCITWDN